MKTAHSFSFADLNRSHEPTRPTVVAESAPLNAVKEETKAEFIFSIMDYLVEELGSRIGRTHPHIPGEQLASRICPVTLENGDWAILVTPDYKNSDSLSEIFQRG